MKLIREIVEELKANGIEDLNDMVHESISALEWRTNEGGMAGQLEYLQDNGYSEGDIFQWLQIEPI